MPKYLNTSLAKTISVVFHPLLMPTLLLGVLFLVAPSCVGVAILKIPTRLSLLSLIFINTFLVPALLIYYFYRVGLVKSLQLESLPDRRLPYFTTALIYALSSYFFGKMMGGISEIAPQIGTILASIASSVFLVGIVSLQWQISAHAVGMSGVLGSISGFIIKFGENLLLYPLIGLVVLSGYVLAARLQLNAHTPAQVQVGFGLGFGVGLIAVLAFI